MLNGDWKTDHRRAQMTAMTPFCNLICIERPVTLQTFITNPLILLQWFKNGWKPRQLGENLQVFKSIAFVPYSVAEKFIVLRFINKIIIHCFIKFGIQLYVKHPIVLMLSHPMQRQFVGLFKEELLCYEITDAYDKITHFSASENRKISKIERILLSRADIVFTSAKNLEQDKLHYNKNTFFIPNAADIEFFSKSLSHNTLVPDDLAKISKPRIGLIGHITANVDLEILIMIAEKHPEWSLVLIGMINGNRKFRNGLPLERLRKLSNVHFLGLKPYESLPMYQKGLDVCLLPYKLNEFNKYVYPNKIHQYFAGGKPIVSTDLPEVRPFANLVFIAKNKEEFIEVIYKTLKDKGSNDHLIQKRLQIARENSVEIRARQRIHLLENALRNKILKHPLGI